MKFTLTTKFIACIGAILIASSAFADEKNNDGWDDTTNRTSIQKLFDNKFNNSRQRDMQFDLNSIIKTSLSCGLAPLPPLGCRNPTCICDQSGQNCRWVFQCN